MTNEVDKVINDVESVLPMPFNLTMNADGITTIWKIINFVLSSTHPFSMAEVAIINQLKNYVIAQIEDYASKAQQSVQQNAQQK